MKLYINCNWRQFAVCHFIGHSSFNFYSSYGDGVGDLVAVCITNDATRNKTRAYIGFRSSDDNIRYVQRCRRSVWRRRRHGNRCSSTCVRSRRHRAAVTQTAQALTVAGSLLADCSHLTRWIFIHTHNGRLSFVHWARFRCAVNTSGDITST